MLLINLGRTPITNDITKVQPYISLGPEVNILQTKITKTVPDKITCSLKINKDSIIVDSPLLNPNDKIYFTALVSGDNYDYRVGGRIAGIRSVELWNRIAEELNPRELPRSFYWALLGLLFVGKVFTETIRETIYAKSVIRLWQDNSNRQKNVLEMQLNNSYKLLYNRRYAQDRINPILEKMDESENVPESIAKDISGIMNTTAKHAKKMNIRLALITAAFILPVGAYIASLLIRVYG